MRILTAALLFTAVASAQEAPANPLVSVSKAMFGIAKGDILGSLEKVSDELWSFAPTTGVRTFGQQFAHVADAQYEFCGVASEGHSVSKDIEKTKRTKAEIGPALRVGATLTDLS
jgi:DinB superfamily